MNIALSAGPFVCVLPPLSPQLLDQIQYERCRGGGEEVPREREALWVGKRISRARLGPCLRPLSPSCIRQAMKPPSQLLPSGETPRTADE